MESLGSMLKTGLGVIVFSSTPSRGFAPPASPASSDLCTHPPPWFCEFSSSEVGA